MARSPLYLDAEDDDADDTGQSKLTASVGYRHYCVIAMRLVIGNDDAFRVQGYGEMWLC